MAVFRSVRKGEGGNVAAGFCALFGLIGSHSILETARDALFLSSIPATRLPFVYIAIALVTLGITQLRYQMRAPRHGRRAVSLSILGAGGVTIAFWLALPWLGDAGLYALYIWSGVLAALVVVQLWSLLADIFTVTQAKRLYGLIGTGGVLGAIVGSAAAAGLSRVMEPRGFVLIAGLGLLATSCVPAALGATSASGGESSHHGTTRSAGRYVFTHTYPRAIAWLVIVGAATVTFADYIFKSVVARNVADAELATTFASIYLLLNVLSLVMQLVVASWVMRRFSVLTALAILPALLLCGGGAMVAIGGLAAAVSIKAADGSLRYSLNRTAIELLYVPLSDRARHQVKMFIDVLGHRGGQAAASLGILGFIATDIGPTLPSIGLIVLATTWLGVIVRLRKPYLELFRRHLQRSQIQHLRDFPDFDMASLENIMAALDSPKDQEVVAALDLLELEGKTHVVPALILHHPADSVVIRALELFASERRITVLPLLERYLDHPSSRVRSEIIATHAILAYDEAFLRERLTVEGSASVRSTIVVQLIAAGSIVGSDARDSLNAICRDGSAEARMALAEAIGSRRHAQLAWVLQILARDDDSDVRLAAAEAMGALGRRELIPDLLQLLAHERTRSAARRGLRDLGAPAFRALERALSDASLTDLVRWQIPRTLAHIDPDRAATVLLDHLPSEGDGMLRFRTIRCLASLVRRDPRLRLDRELLHQVLRDTISRAYRYLDRRLILERGAAAYPEVATESHALLVAILRDKHDHAVDRLFRLLDLEHRSENFAAIQDGLQAKDPLVRASSLELLDNILEAPYRIALRGLVDAVDDEERQILGRDFHEPLELSYVQILERMLGSSSDSVQDVTAYHIAEVPILDLRGALEALPPTARERPDIRRALEILRGLDSGDSDRRLDHVS